MVTKIETSEAPEVKDQERIPSHDELLLDQFTQLGFVLVQFIGSKTIMRLAPSPTGIIRKFGAENYGLVSPKEFLMVHQDDVNSSMGKLYYRRPDADEKPKKSEVKLTVMGPKNTTIRVTWKGMPVDDLDPYNRN